MNIVYINKHMLTKISCSGGQLMKICVHLQRFIKMVPPTAIPLFAAGGIEIANFTFKSDVAAAEK